MSDIHIRLIYCQICWNLNPTKSAAGVEDDAEEGPVGEKCGGGGAKRMKRRENIQLQGERSDLVSRLREYKGTVCIEFQSS